MPEFSNTIISLFHNAKRAAPEQVSCLFNASGTDHDHDHAVDVDWECGTLMASLLLVLSRAAC